MLCSELSVLCLLVLDPPSYHCVWARLGDSRFLLCLHAKSNLGVFEFDSLLCSPVDPVV